MERKADRSVRVVVLTLLLPILLQSVPAYVVAQAANNTGASTLTLAVFVSGITPNGTNAFSGDLDGRPFITAVQLAVELVNNRTDILPGYMLEFTTNDTQCQAGPSVRGFIDQIFMEPTKIMIIGSDCSTSSAPIAELAPFWNLVQISHVSSGPQLSNNGTYSTFLRMVSSDVAIVNGIVQLMQRFSWTRIAVISQQESLFTSTYSTLQGALEGNNFSNPRDFTFNSGENPQGDVQRLADSSTRIIFLNVYPAYAMEILCQAYREGMTHRNGYVWLLFAWYPNNWWLDQPAARSSYNATICSVLELENMVQYAIAIDHFPFVPAEDQNATTDAGLTLYEFGAAVRSRLSQLDEDVDDSLLGQVQFIFDAVWTAALALNATLAEYELSDFTYQPESELSLNITNAIYRNALALQFRGISGQVAFNEIGDRDPMTRFFQYQRNSSGQIEAVQIGSEGSFDNEDRIFPFGTPKDEQFVYISLALFITYTILAGAGIILALVFLIFNLYFRNRKVVKLSSPYLNVLIIVGVIMFYVDVIFFGMDERTVSRCTVNAFCMLRVWIASIAFSLVFGTIFAKTWRVYYIFYSTNRHRRSKKIIIQDWVLLVMVICLIVIDVVFLIFVTAFPSSRLQLENREVASNDQSLPQIITLCVAEGRFAWLGVLFAYKGILLIVGLFLAFETRNVKVRHLNDSKLIGMSVYGIVVLSLALAALGILLETFIEVYYAVVGIMIILGITFLLCLFFIPKIYGLWKDPMGVNIMSTSTIPQTGTFDNSGSRETISQLTREVERLKKELDKLSKPSRRGSMLVPEVDNTSHPVGALSPVQVKEISIDLSSGALETTTTHVNLEKSTVEGNEDK